jgi:hypothetical protein
MERGLFNITSETTTTLVDQYTPSGAVSQVGICNCHASIDVTVRLFLDDGTNQTSIVENLVIPAGVTLLLDHGLSFRSDVLSLKLATDAVDSTTVDVNVIIK